MAFAFFAFSEYNWHKRYESFFETLISLLCIFAGDEIQPSFAIYSQNWGISGYIYGISYTLFFFVVIQNMMVLLVTQGYEKALGEQEKEDKIHHDLKVLEKAQEEGYALNKKGVVSMIKDNKSFDSLSNVSNLELIEDKNTPRQDLITESSLALAPPISINYKSPNTNKSKHLSVNSVDFSKSVKKSIRVDPFKVAIKSESENDLDRLNSILKQSIRYDKEFEPKDIDKLIETLEEKLISKEVYTLKDSIMSQIMPKSDLKITNLWRKVRQFG